MEALRDWGQTMHESDLKAGLLKLNSSLQFDPGGRLDLNHPFIDSRQGVFYNNRHICSMERGIIPEFNVWGVVTYKDAFGEEHKRRSHIVKVGWRHTLQVMVDRGVPNVTWPRLSLVLGVLQKDFVGDPMECAIAKGTDYELRPR